MQGVGWALNEEYIYNAKGTLENPGFLDYRMPVASDLPMIETILVEVPNPQHPYGVRGVGEVPIIPPLAAVGNAIARATGVRMVDLPMSPPRLSARARRGAAAADGGGVSACLTTSSPSSGSSAGGGEPHEAQLIADRAVTRPSMQRSPTEWRASDGRGKSTRGQP